MALSVIGASSKRFELTSDRLVTARSLGSRGLYGNDQFRRQ